MCNKKNDSNIYVILRSLTVLRFFADVHLCYPEYTTKLHDDDFASSASAASGLEVHDACGTSEFLAGALM